MKFLFIQKTSFPAAGPMMLSSYLKKHGYEVDLILFREEKNIIKAINKRKPDIIGFPTFTGDHDWVTSWAKKIKKEAEKPPLIILGGPHPTYYPDIIEKEGVDIIARGEAEETLLELMEALRLKRDYKNIAGLWVKDGSQIIRNEIRPLQENLEKYPLPDRDIYYKYSFLKKASAKQFLTGRGCPFQCTFCANRILKQIYEGKGRFVRRRSPEGAVNEIYEVKKKYGLKTVSFTDDVFLTEKRWLEEFLKKFKEKINLPFMCNVTANLIDEETIKLLKKYGCYGISMGVESGNQEIRFKVLKKFITNEHIIDAGRQAKKNNLILKTYNILALPGETLENAFETLYINVKIKSDFAACSLLQPFPKYEITEYAKEKGFLPRDYDVKDVHGGIYRYSPLKLKDKYQIVNLQRLFFLGVKFPRLIPLIKKLIKLHPNPVFTFIGQVLYGFNMSRVHRLTLGDMIRYALHINPFDV